MAARPFAAPDAAVALPEGSVFLDRALQRHVSFPALYRAYCRNLGREGVCGGRADDHRGGGPRRLGRRTAARLVAGTPADTVAEIIDTLAEAAA